MNQYTNSQLRSYFQSSFNRDTWKALLHNLFRADKLRTEPEHFTSAADAEQGYYMGSIDTADAYRIGLFYYIISNGSIAHKKVGLRNLVKKFINPSWGEFDAAIVVFDDKKEWRLSFVCDIKEEATAPKRFTFSFGEHDNHYRTAVERFSKLQEQPATFENIRRAFSVEALSDDFFDGYRDLYADFVQYITGKRYIKECGKWVERSLGEPNSQYETTFYRDDKLVRDYIKKMFGRIVFLYFLQRKGWLAGNRQYMHDLFAKSEQKDNFLDGVLEPLFFEVLNEKPEYRTSEAKDLPDIETIPYLNGGLFAKDDIDDRTCVFPKDYFSRLFNFLDSYNFTIDENDADDAEIGIDPEMLGRIFENLLEDNKDKGAFYTPKEIVDYMCRESIIAYLQNDATTDTGKEQLRQFVETFDGERLSIEQRKFIKDKLKSVKICDPAIGSGAFPMGLVNLLSKLYQALHLSTDFALIKRHIMEQNIYGVDIEKGAVDIARLRFWLAMIVEEKEPMPLPNLHFKIMQGNSLLESYNGIDLSDLTKVKSVHASLFDSDDSERESLIADLKRYYQTSDHTERDRLFTDITRNVRRQLYAKQVILPEGTDPSENSDFFLWHTWFTDVFEQGGFDIVIGNPPYIQLQKSIGIKTTDKRGREHEMKLGDLYEDEGFKTFAKTGDIYCLFYEQGAKMLKPEGHLCYITSNKWMRAGYGEKLRSFFATQTNPEILIDFGGVQVFESATVDTNILLFSKGKNQNSTQAATIKKEAHRGGSFNLSDFMRHNAGEVSFNSSESWVILSPIELSIKHKIESVGVPLKDWDINIYRGVLTGYNEAFIISTEKRNEILANCASDEERKRTEELIRPILRGRDIKRYSYEWANLWLIATFPARKYDIEQYPAVKKYLLSFAEPMLREAGLDWVANNHLADFCKQKLNQTGQYIEIESKRIRIGSSDEKARKATSNKWFETQDSISYWDDFSNPKIMWKRIGSILRFSYDSRHLFGLDSTCFCVSKYASYLVCVLNSPMGHYLLRNAPKTGTGDLLISVQAVNPIQIPIIEDIEWYNIQLQLLLESDGNNESPINESIYQLYNLTDEEIKFIENQ